MTAPVVVYGLIAVMSASAACLLGLNWRAFRLPLAGASPRLLFVAARTTVRGRR